MADKQPKANDPLDQYLEDRGMSASQPATFAELRALGVEFKVPAKAGARAEKPADETEGTTDAAPARRGDGGGQ